MAKEHHQVKVVRIPEIKKHPNADTLGLVEIGGYQVVVKLGEYQPGDLAVYIPPDSVVPEEPRFAFIWERPESSGKTVSEKDVPVRRRRVTVRRFRKEWSEGLLMPCLRFFLPPDSTVWAVQRSSGTLHCVMEGDDVTEILGITHYQPPEPEEAPLSLRAARQNKRWPRSFRGWFYFLFHLLGFGGKHAQRIQGINTKPPKNLPPIYDVESFKHFPDIFQPGEPVVVTEKIHGCNARYQFDGKKIHVGSRQLWKSKISPCVWRKALKDNPWIEEWCRLHPRWTLYGEVVPTQKGFDYGIKNGATQFFAFDALDDRGNWVDLRELIRNEFLQGNAGKIPGNLRLVPTLYEGPYDKERILKLVDGPSQVTEAGHIREGIVIRANPPRHVPGFGLAQLKIVSNLFLEKDSKLNE